jgi:hypothetical protein
MGSGLDFTQEEYEIMRREKIYSLIDNILVHLEKEWRTRKIDNILLTAFNSVEKLYERFQTLNQVSPNLKFGLTNDKNHIQAIMIHEDKEIRLGMLTMDKNFDHFAIVTHNFTDPNPKDKIDTTVQSTTYIRLSILLRRLAPNDNKTRNVLEKILLDFS